MKHLKEWNETIRIVNKNKYEPISDGIYCLSNADYITRLFDLKEINTDYLEIEEQLIADYFGLTEV